jgi:hypothetical protein
MRLPLMTCMCAAAESSCQSDGAAQQMLHCVLTGNGNLPPCHSGVTLVATCPVRYPATCVKAPLFTWCRTAAQHPQAA